MSECGKHGWSHQTQICPGCMADVQQRQLNNPFLGGAMKELPEWMLAIQPGPCVVCGLRNYALSVGGPSICPACDCGDFGPNVVSAQKRRIKELEHLLDVEREAAVFSFDHKKHILEQLAQAEAKIAEMRKLPDPNSWDGIPAHHPLQKMPDTPTGAS